LPLLTRIRFWASQYEGHSSNEVNVLYYLAVYGALLLVGTFVYSGGYTVFLFGSISASRQIHERLISSVLAANLRFLDQTPVGRIISRFTLDIRAVDGPISSMLADFSECIAANIFQVLTSF
jgi:ABC-type multidrug transport system fused ATPase/permease subunit